MAGRVALAAVLAALALAVLYGACLAPSGRMGLTAVAGLFPTAAVISGGFKVGLLCYGGAALLALLVLPDKGLALLFALFFGLYPVLKAKIEGLRRLAVELVLKLLLFNGALTLFRAGLRTIFLSALPLPKGLPLWVLYLVGNVVFLIYDLGLTKLIALYIARVDQPLRRGRGV